MADQPTVNESVQKEAARVTRRSFFGGLLAIGTAGMGALLAVPVLRFVFYPLYTKAGGIVWSDVGSVDELPTNEQPLHRTVTFTQRDGWREVVSAQSVYVTRNGSGQFQVLSAICPHMGCSVSWQADHDRIRLPVPWRGVQGRRGTHIRTAATRDGPASYSCAGWQAASGFPIFSFKRTQPGIVELGAKRMKALKEDKKTDASGASKGSLPRRLFRWLDKRTGVDELMKESLDEPIPGGARLAYVFGSGLIFIFISQIITGICLALYYVPSAETAHTSVAYISKQVAAGAFLRSLHYYGSSAMIIVLALHFLQTFLYGSFKGRRELLWISGAVLSLLVLAMGFTGYLLPWDQKAYFATAVGTNIVGQVPLIGNWLTRLLRGGDTIGTLTLSRFYVAHVFLIPAAIFAFIAVHIALFRKAGPAGPINEDPIEPKLPAEGFIRARY